MTALRAHWIWRRQRQRVPYHQTLFARRRFRLPRVRSATIRITADSFYRLFINDEWVGDGPCRCWPHHWQYDVMDVTARLRAGQNEILVVASHWGTVTCRDVPQRAGLLVQLDVISETGRRRTVVSDGAWDVAPARAWVANTANFAIQHPPQEHYDARLATGARWSKADVICRAGEGPWRNLEPRDVALLTREPRPFRRFVAANVVRRDWLGFALPLYRLLHEGFIQGSPETTNAAAAATVVVSDRSRRVCITGNFRITVNGKAGRDGTYRLKRGHNLLLAAAARVVAYEKADPSLRIVDTEGLRLRNPLDPGHPNPWCLIPLEEGRPRRDGRFAMPDGAAVDRAERMRRLDARCAALGAEVGDARALRSRFKGRVKCLPRERMLADDSHNQFVAREVLRPTAALVANPSGLMYDNEEATVVRPSRDGDIELLYDLGEQSIGYYTFELFADEGVCVDIYGLEHIAPDGTVQHTRGVRNGLRYVTRAGRNAFTSLRRRGGRYVFITLRHMKRPVRIRRLQLIESTYPADAAGAFRCEDALLEKIWDISARAVRLCMEDTFTDCPLYEQVCWVGDARNEALFNYTAFGATDIVRRVLLLAARSLRDESDNPDGLPMVRCQVPSCRGGIIPAWSFLWGMAVWEHYWYAGDRPFLRRMWPYVLRNLEHVERSLDARGLFSAPLWNMFDWAAVDDRHTAVLHNSLLAVGALDAALRCAGVLGEEKARLHLRRLRGRLARAVRRLWDSKRRAFPDSIHEEGSLCEHASQHTSFLALLYDVADARIRPHAVRNTLSPPPGMARVGSPFAMQFRYEAMEKIGEADAVVASIRRAYAPMVEADASTVWETFPHTRPAVHGAFPTRSHCHGWSAAPVHFLNRIVLGIRQTVPGGTAFEISPRLNGLAWAEGTTATARGPVRVRWRVEGNRLNIEVHAPDGVKLTFVGNDTHRPYAVHVNGRPLRRRARLSL